ncbi:MAG: methyltransferase domain-containing protein [Porticoccaceae bacterium]|nr:methyltransferase domain-containing protein [Porticoccaceae bacterium]
MATDSYYRDHWLDIDEQRLAAYQQLFQWHPSMEPLLAAAEIGDGHSTVDYGCGPGGLTLELARRVGAKGHVHGVDLNETFVAQAREALDKAGYADSSTIHHIADDHVPLRDASADRLVCKNVLEYVSDYSAVMAEFYRVIKPGGIAQLIDSDWGMIAVEPLGQEKLQELLSFAQCAYNTPTIGRVLYSEMKQAGFSNVRVKIIASADTKGRLLPVLNNFIGYAKVGGMAADRADALLEEIKASINAGIFMMVLPQFIVTGIK